MIRLLLPALSLFALTGCIPPAPPEAAPAPLPPGKCDATGVQAHVGANISTHGLVDSIVRQSGSRNARVIHPGQMVTMDFREDRVNVRVDGDGKILSINCG
ncbi:I78 family peptidase inhibitor [Sphingomonas sp.]|uniref:I78 family peptidase inhibitor n=1 Tax=Sphingomonas sp. TaxID=28214 RepID=UPI001B0DCAA0|nr:I78 family peptidase inhibitor [Sphingomonas sp.]MBO9711879.1 hypothetical protein [Sphingomonas sp.]